MADDGFDLDREIEEARRKVQANEGKAVPPDQPQAGDIPAPEFNLDQEIEAARGRVAANGGKAVPPPADDALSVGEDLGLSLLTGARKAITSDIPGMLGSVQQQTHDVVKDYTGLDLSKVPAIHPMMTPLGFGKRWAPTSEEWEKVQHDIAGDTLTHTPQEGGYGKYAEEVGRFMPNMIGGPAGVENTAARWGIKALTRAGIPGVVTQGAHDLAEKYLPESWVGPVTSGAAAVSGGASAAGENAAVRRFGAPPKLEVPLTQKLKDVSGKQYDEFGRSSVILKPKTTRRIGQQLEVELYAGHKRPESSPNTFAEIERLKNRTTPMDMQDWLSARKVFGEQAYNGKGSDKAAGAHAMRVFDRAIPKFQGDLLKGTITEMVEASQVLRKANANYAAYKRAQKTGDILSDAKMVGRSPFSGKTAGEQAGARMLALSKEETGKSRTLGMSPAERQRMKRIAEGEGGVVPLMDAAKKMGGTSVLGGSLFNLLGGGGAWASQSAWPLALNAVPFAGGALRGKASAITMRDMHGLHEDIRRRSPLAKEMGPMKPSENELWERALLLYQLQKENEGQGQ